jgi:zinc protease
VTLLGNGCLCCNTRTDLQIALRRLVADRDLYLNHPYGRPVIGWRHEIEKLTLDDALAFYRRYYTPNNAVLVIAGDVTADEVKALAEATYGKIAPRSEIGARQRPQEPTQVASRHVTLSDPRVEQPSLQRSYLVPSAATGKPGEAEALEVLSQILGGGTTGRLYRALVIERQVALNAGAWYQGSGLDATRFGVYGSPKPGTTLPQLEEAIEAVIAELLAKGITADELERVKNRLIADAVFARDSQASLARWYGVALTTGSSVESVNSWTDRIRAVNADAVLAAAKTWLDKRRSVTGHLIKDHPKTGEKRS